MALWNRFQSILFGGAIGAAARVAIEPQIAPAQQLAWKNNQHRVLEVGELAQLVAQSLVELGDAETEGALTGFNPNRVAALVELEQHAPGVAEAMHMWRLGEVDFADVQHALRKAQLEPRWDASYKSQKTLPLQPADLANAVQQGFIPDAGILAGDTGGTHDITPPVEELPIETLREFAAGALDRDHAAVLAQLVGLPPGVMELLDLWNRGVVTEQAVEHGIREGHTKTKWTSALKQLRYVLITPGQAATARLKGWRSKAESDALGALQGATPEVMELLYLIQGRPAAPVQMQTAWARGIDGPDGVPMNFAQFEKGIRESDIRPEWAPMLWGIRHAYPSLFQLRRAVEDGSITPARALVILRYERYEDQDAQGLVASWTTGGTAGGKAETVAALRDEFEGYYISEAQFRAALASLGYAGAALDHEVHLADAKRVKRYRDAVLTKAHKMFVSHAIDEATAAGVLDEVRVDPAAQSTVLQLWTFERDVERLVLSQAQIRAAYRKNVLSLAEATQDLVDRGMSAADAAVYLGS